MRNRIVGVLAALLLLCAPMSGCWASQKAQREALYPALDLAWPGVRGDAERGGAEDEFLDGFGDALQARQATTLKLTWPGVRAAAEHGIEERQADLEIGPGVAQSLTRRLDEFDRGISRLRGGSP